MKIRKFIFLFLPLFLAGCASVQHISKTQAGYTVPGKDATAADPQIVMMVAPYKVQIDSQMNHEIALLATELVKKQPESTMGNWCADALMYGINKGGLYADFALMNYGGMRVPVITPGPLTIGELFELSPFDNAMMIVDVPGNIVDTLFQYIAAKEGWPVSHEVRMEMAQKKMIRCTINGAPIDPRKTYKIAMPDYVANGGDDAKFFIPLSRFQTGILQRDILIDYARSYAEKGIAITATVEGRITKQ